MLTYISFFFIICSNLFPQEINSLKTVVFFDLESNGGISNQELKDFNNYFRRELINQKIYNFTDEESKKKLMSDIVLKQECGEDCEFEIGKLLYADYKLIGSISKDNSSCYSVNINFIDVETKGYIYSQNVKSSNFQDTYKILTYYVIKDLVDKKIAEKYLPSFEEGCKQVENTTPKEKIKTVYIFPKFDFSLPKFNFTFPTISLCGGKGGKSFLIPGYGQICEGYVFEGLFYFSAVAGSAYIASKSRGEFYTARNNEIQYANSMLYVGNNIIDNLVLYNSVTNYRSQMEQASSNFKLATGSFIFFYFFNVLKDPTLFPRKDKRSSGLFFNYYITEVPMTSSIENYWQLKYRWYF